MGINVKNAAVVAEVRILADKLGLGLTDTIAEAVKARLAQIDNDRNVEAKRRMDLISELQERLKPYVTPDITSSCDELYDEDGAPA